MNHSQNESSLKPSSNLSSQELTEHFFRNEYGKIVSVITRYLGADQVETAEDVVQETLLKAVDHWQNRGIPENPQAWLYTTAKNLTLNILKRKKYQQQYESEVKQQSELDANWFTEKVIMDEQLKMMFACCHSSISENSQITLILKILCGFSISEISNAFFSSNDTINKRLVRGRKQLRESDISIDTPGKLGKKLPIVLKALYLLFNEGYSPSKRNEAVRYDLCLEAIRLGEIVVSHSALKEKADCVSLLALMYLNASRFEARTNEHGDIIEMHKQDRSKWNRALITKGIEYLSQATEQNKTSVYLILATISANHCIASTFESTNWNEILSLYDSLILLEDSPITRLNRCVALSKTQGNKEAILAMRELESASDIGSHHLFYATLGEFYRNNNELNNAVECLEKAILLTNNKRNIDLLRKKLMELVPI